MVINNKATSFKLFFCKINNELPKIFRVELVIHHVVIVCLVRFKYLVQCEAEGIVQHPWE